MAKPYSLRLYTSAVAGTPGFIGDLTNSALGWRRSIRGAGGYWIGNFEMTGDLATLQQFFYERLGCHVEERSGGVVTWEGMVYEIDLTWGGIQRRRTLENMSNYAIVNYTDVDSGQQAETSAGQAADSVTRYGRKENRVTVTNVTVTEANAQRDTAVKRNAWPWARPVSIGRGSGQASLAVTVCGYAFTLNWRYLSSTTLDGVTGNASTFVSNILTNDAQLVTAGTVNTNTLQVKRESTTPLRAWDAIQRVTGMGDASGNVWRSYVTTGRKLNYEQIVTTTPSYYWRNGSLYAGAALRNEFNPYQVVPGVLRDAEYPLTRSESGSFLGDARDIWIEEVKVDADGRVALTSEAFVDALSNANAGGHE